MNKTVQNRCLIAGIGSPHGDDQAGWLVVDRLCEKNGFHIETQKLSTPLELLDKIEGLDCLVCIDAIEGDEPHGSINRHVWPFETSWQIRNQSTHGMDLVSVLKIAESMNMLPAKVILWTIEGRSWETGAEISSVVENELISLVSCVEQELLITHY